MAELPRIAPTPAVPPVAPLRPVRAPKREPRKPRDPARGRKERDEEPDEDETSAKEHGELTTPSPDEPAAPDDTRGTGIDLRV